METFCHNYEELNTMSRTANNTSIELSLELVHTTEKAVLLSEGEGLNQHWVPKSKIANWEEELEPLTHIEVHIPEWIANKNGWI